MHRIGAALRTNIFPYSSQICMEWLKRSIPTPNKYPQSDSDVGRVDIRVESSLGFLNEFFIKFQPIQNRETWLFSCIIHGAILPRRMCIIDTGSRTNAHAYDRLHLFTCRCIVTDYYVGEKKNNNKRIALIARDCSLHVNLSFFYPRARVKAVLFLFCILLYKFTWMCVRVYCPQGWGCLKKNIFR